MAREITRNDIIDALKTGSLMVLSKLPDMSGDLENYELIRITPAPGDDTRKILDKMAASKGLKLSKEREMRSRMWAAWVSDQLKEKDGVVFIIEFAHRVTRKGLGSIRHMQESWSLREEKPFPTKRPSFIMLGDVELIHSLIEKEQSMLMRTAFPEMDDR